MGGTVAGPSWTSRLSSLTGLDRGELPLWALPVTGAIAGLLHHGIDLSDTSLNLPGHHGLELMAALVFSRLASTRPWAALCAVTGTIGTDLALTSDFLHGLKHVPTYALTAVLVDAAFRLAGARGRGWWVPALIGGLAHVAKPLFFLGVALVTGMTFGFMRHGPVFPLVTHFSFGAVGAVCGAVLARGWVSCARGRGG